MSPDSDPLGSDGPAVTGPQPSPAPPVKGRRGRRAAGRGSENMLPQREGRRTRLERLLVRVIATGGIVGIGVAIAAIMISNGSQGWLTGLVVSVVSVFLAAILWSSRQL
ncbi:MAG: hypothetical protein ACRDMJ_18010 [Solirubrobacteraceae bacterium]